MELQIAYEILRKRNGNSAEIVDFILKHIATLHEFLAFINSKSKIKNHSQLEILKDKLNATRTPTGIRYEEIVERVLEGS